MTMREHDRVRKLCMGLCFVLLSVPGMAQFTYGTTGLLHMPTAEMQRDKTVMLGGGYLNEQAMPSRWTYDTWNYYVNITFFPWLEVAYTCNVFDEMIKRGSAWIHMKNQDRSFHGRLRVWKEGWWKEWTPQLVAGVNDFTTGGSKDYTEMGVDGDGNGYFNRYYLAATKHFSWYGKWGVHAAYLYNRRNLDKLNGMAVGVHYEFDLPGTTLWQKALNGMKLMAEYDSKFVNVGVRYACWKESINIIAEWRECQYPSVGVYFKLHLK